ncbi:hypothetical protein GIB67_020252 [Kingdonia uniflora]|uniref:E3 ubiquitin-protein ligase listerin n=1 Tax=Kingdonia uniflora TaxID=39325 RepID=A0A7J7P410_9MAGN|nr:hypothetical protein GIB67_020252 [Kingdonia uniflora]
MGKQKGDGARSKTRPSSSSIAASLLPSGTASVGFGGYVGSSRLDSSRPSEDSTPFLLMFALPFGIALPFVLAILSDSSPNKTFSLKPLMSDVDSEVAQHLKRLGRKDSTTKVPFLAFVLLISLLHPPFQLKALASLCDLFKQKSGEDIAQIIPQWAFEYKKLSQDYNREVRRATHVTMTNLVTTVGRGLALHLKSLMGPWWLSQFDPVSEVSQAARRSLQDAFPALERRVDALILCTSDIFLHLEENLKLTPQTMLDKTAPLDELEEIHQRVISTSLLALATLMDILFDMQVRRPSSENITSEPKNIRKAREMAMTSAERILSSHKCFLEFFKSKSTSIRSATYSVLGSFVKHIPHAFNEGNMKTLSAAILGGFQEKDPTCHSSLWDTILLFSKRFPDSWGLINVQKTVLNRFWQFLRNGCYGSQQASYPVLILFLDSIPPKAISGKQFFLNFFQSLWAGRNPSSSSIADLAALLTAFKECFLWSVHNASRYCEGIDAVHHFQSSLVDDILVNLLWHDYLSLVSENDQDGVVGGKSSNSCEADIHKHPLSYKHDLGTCIVEILSNIFLKECDLLRTFCTTFKENSLDIIQRSPEHVDEVVNFLFLLDQHAVKKGETWPLEYLTGPMVTEVFPLIKYLDSPDAVKLLSATVSVFGPKNIVSLLGHSEPKSTNFLQIFEEIFVPWCLSGINRSSSARLDLLLTLVEDEVFNEQWCTIITFATKLEEHVGTELGYLDFDHIDVLAMLMEKVKGKIGSGHRQGSHSEEWHHKLLDSTAICVAKSCPSSVMSPSRFLRAVLGGSAVNDRNSLVSRDSMILVFEELLMKLIPFLMESSFTWAKDARSLISSPGLKGPMQEMSSYTHILEMAKFSLEVLEDTLFSLKIFDEEECTLVPSILAAVFIIDWECRMTTQLAVVDCSATCDDIVDAESKFEFGQRIHAFRCKISSHFRRSLNKSCLRRLRDILIQTIRSAVLEIHTYNTDKVPSVCCEWFMEVIDFNACDQFEEQNLLDQLLDKSNFWPLWVLPALNNGTRSATIKLESSALIDVHVSRHHQFVAFIVELILKLGVDIIIGGCLKQTSLSTSVEAHDELSSSYSYSRAWLAAELLCIWNWRVGNVLSSFLPLLSEFAKSEKRPDEEFLADSVIDILLNGALVYGASDEISFFNVWVASDDELESIQEPFLRALVCLLSSLMVKDKIWGNDKTSYLFQQLIDKLFVGTIVNRRSLRILPFVMNILIQQLRRRSSISDENLPHESFSEENLIHVHIEGWLQRALLLPPITAWQIGQDMEEWVEVIISCYPLNAMGGIGALQLASKRDISHLEKSLLVEMLRKQRPDGTSTLSLINPSPSMQITLSKLIAISVGYCWKEFNEDDWEFVFSLLRGWVESVVVVFEDMVENTDDAVKNSFPSNFEVILDPSLMNISRNAIYIFSMFCGLIELRQEEAAESLDSAKTEKWNQVKDRILESVLRVFFAAGIIEAVASSYSQEASNIVASSRLAYPHFWELVASSVINSPEHVRNAAVRSIDLWELSKGPISSLYAILFSSKPISSLQFAAYIMLSTEPVSHISITNEEDTASFLNGVVADDQEIDQTPRFDSSSEKTMHLREEISDFIEKSPSDILEMDLMAPRRVNIFISWAMLLSHLQSLPSTSSTRQRLIQHIQDSANSTILDCLFQHIPLKPGSLKKKEVVFDPRVSQAAMAATRAITTGSLLFSVESLWPVETEGMASVAGAIYGLMLHILPAYVRDWFTSSRDRSASLAIEFFTKSWCSPPLIADELSQIKRASVADEEFSVSVSKSANEVVATYKKEETGMDLVIRLPPSYPLRPVDVDCTRSLGISDVKRRKWLLSMLAFVRSQNGALAEAIRTWKSNFDKEFEGVEECPICYSIIHTADNSLPKLACKTCKHKFHKACLYKWFATSHKSTCPLCQSPF